MSTKVPDIQDQIALEDEMVSRGAARYKKAQESATKTGDSQGARALIRDFLEPLAEELIQGTNGNGPRKYGRAYTALKQIDPYSAMFIALRAMFNSFTTDVPLVQTAIKIGRMVEDEIRFTKFEERHKAYHSAVMKSFKERGSTDYRYKQRVMTMAATREGDQWIAWDNMLKADVGMTLLDIILRCTDLIQKDSYTTNRGMRKTITVLMPTPEAEAWMKEHDEHKAMLNPEFAPCIVKPDDWTSLDQGGYYTATMRRNIPMVKTASKAHKKMLGKMDLGNIIRGLNTAQSTEWKVNSRVLEVLSSVWHGSLGIGIPGSEKLTPRPSPVPRELPVEEMTEQQLAAFKVWKKEANETYTRERERIGKSFQVARILRMAREYEKYNRFWYVWYADFRGRFYAATTGFSPQGPDFAKGILKFANGKPLGKSGWAWLRIHGANRYGYDKADYADRIKWVEDRHAEWIRAASDPLSYRETWASADKPYQFLAWIFEYADAHAFMKLGGKIEDFVSYLPIGLDGSCNGLQNFSAMLRDKVGGTSTNLVPAHRPGDIYSEVAAVATGKIRLAASKDVEEAKRIVEFFDKYSNGRMPRSMAKRPVMTLPYGATRSSAQEYIYSSIVDIDRKFFEDPHVASRWITPYLWEAIGEVVIAARVGMDWLQKAAWRAARNGNFCAWPTHDGFLAVQHSRKIETVQVKTQLAGTYQVVVGTQSDIIDPYKQRSGVAPNFVHSMDSAHMRETIKLAVKEGITSFALIHDDYGTHAGDTAKLHECIRRAFVNMYRSFDPLQAFKTTQEKLGTKLPPLPEKGELDITDVLRSLYFFG